MHLIPVLRDVFISRGYQILVSSEENSYLLLERNSSTMAVGYSDPGHDVTEGEAEMFVSMAENSSADSILFISPEKLGRKARNVLEKANCATWDRMALAIAIGEQVLTSPEKAGDDKEEVLEPAFDAGNLMDLFSGEAIDPLVEETPDTIEKGEREGIDEDSNSIQVRKVDFPDISGVDDVGGKKASVVSEDVLLNAWAGFDDWKDQGKESEEKTEKADQEPIPNLPEMPMMEIQSETPPEKKPWIGSTLAPIRCKREEACAKAGVPNDTELDLEHVPNLLVSVSYSLRADDGASVSREGEYLYDPIKRGLIDIPSALAEELRTTLSIWDGMGPAKGMGRASEDDKGYVRALKDRLTRERHAEDRMVRETLMSTIYQEVRYLFDPSSFNIRWSRRIVVPYWIKRDEKGELKWMVDGYLGRFIQTVPRD